MSAQLQRALRDVTERLAAELGSPCAQAPAWCELQWTVARAVAAIHGVSPLLWSCLNWQGPAPWSRFLESQWRHTALRHMRICSLLEHIDAEARDRGIAVMALKGSALHQLGLYAAGDRPMADIDLLVQPSDAAMLASMLGAMDYELSNSNWREAVFVPVGANDPASIGEHADNAIKIEVHERIAERLAWRITDVTGSVFPVRPHAGLNPYDSPASLMRHLLLHAAGSMSRQSLRLLQLHDIALLAAALEPEDWKTLENEASRDELWWAYPPLRMAHHYYPNLIPPESLPPLERSCPFWLRRAATRARLYEVSLSYPWVDAFPAMAWSRSTGELLKYMSHRLHPSAELVVARRFAAATEPWARRTEWSHLPQARRMWRWVISRPTRPATWHALAAAFTPNDASAACP